MEQRDIPIQTLKDDEFGIEKYVNALRDFIRNSGTPLTIALQGEWGSGKSSFMRILDSMLCDPALPTSERYESIWLNTWDLFLESDYEVAVKRLVFNLLNQLEEHFEKLTNDKKSEQRKEMIKDYLRSFSTTALGLVNLNNELSEKVVDSIFSKGRSSEVRQVKHKFENYITEEVSRKNNGITDKAFLIFVDDLDRLEPKLAVTLLEALKNLFDIKNCIFILAIDYDVVATGVEQKYGVKSLKNRDIAKDYFDKMIQVPYMIPMAQYDIKGMVMDRLRSFDFFSRQSEYMKYEDMSVEIVTLATRKNPRAIKRLLNMLQLATAIEERDNDHPNKNYTGAFRTTELLFMALQLSFPEVYTRLADNTDLSGWTRDICAGERKGITDPDRTRYQLDKTWKEIIFEASSESDTARHSYPRVIQLLEIYEELSRQCERNGESVRKAFGIVDVVNIKGWPGQEVLYNGTEYDRSSQTQFRQGEYLLSKLELSGCSNVLDIGCGNGKTTIELWKKNMDMCIDAFDISQDQIMVAQKNLDEMKKSLKNPDHLGKIIFYTRDAMALEAQKGYDLIFSNATLHWISDQEAIYRKMFEALIPGGKLAIHQGGAGTYQELHDLARQAGENIGIGDKLEGWRFPAQYLTEEEMIALLEKLGYTNIDVDGEVTDESENPNLVENFATASLIYYKNAGLTDEEFERLKEEYFRLSKDKSAITSHRLYILAERPK